MVPLRRLLTALSLALATAWCAPPLHAATLTVGWKIPMELLEKLEPDFRGKIHKLEQPPGESAFFAAGDELWDVAAEIRAKMPEPPDYGLLADPFKPGPEPAAGAAQAPAESRAEAPAEKKPRLAKRAPDGWMVWDQRSGMLIVRGYWDEVLAVETLLGLDGSGEKPVSPEVRLTLEMTGGDGKPTRHVTMQLQNDGEDKNLNQDGLSGELSLQMEQSPIGALSLDVEWDAGSAHWHYAATSELMEGSPLMLAKAGSGAEAWTLTAKMERVLPDGSPFPPARMTEKDGHLSEIKADGVWQIRRPVDEKRSLVIFHAPIFGENQQGPLRPDQPVMKNPPELAGELPVELGDARPALEETSPALKGRNDFLAGFDPKTNDFYFIGDEAFLREIGELVGQARVNDQQLWLETNDAGGGFGSIMRSGEKFLIARSTAGEEDMSLTMEANLGNANWLIHCQLELILPDDLELNSAVSVDGKEPVEIARHTAAGVEKSITLTAKSLGSRAP